MNVIQKDIDYFAGDDDYVTVTSPVNMDPTAQVTVSAWIKIGDGYYGEIATRGDSYGLRVWDTGQILFYKYIGSSQWTNMAPSGVDVTDNTFHHIVGVQRSTGMYLYVDGQQKDSNTDTTAISYGLGSTAKIGMHGNGNPGYNFTGTIDEVRVSNVGRNDAWVKASYESERDHLIDYEGEPGSTLLTYNSKYVVTSATAVQTSSTSLQDDTQASQAFSLTATQTVLVIYQANNVYGDTMSATGMQNAIGVDGTDYANSWDSPCGANYPARNTVFWIGKLGSGSHTIKGRFAVVSSGTATISNRVLLIYILNGDAYLYLDDPHTATVAGTTPINDTYASFTFTPSGTCKAMVLYNIANSYGATEDQAGKRAAIRIGTTDYSIAEKAQTSAGGSINPDSVFTAWALQLSTSSTTVTGRFAANTAGTVTISRRQLGVLMFADDTLLDTVSSDTQASTTSSSLVDDAQATISRTTTDASCELLVVAMGTKRYGTSSSQYGECYGISVDSSDKANSRGSPYGSAHADSAATAYAQTMTAGDHTIQGRFSNNQGSNSAVIDSRRMVALWLGASLPPEPSTNFAFIDGGGVAIGTGETTIATLSTSSFDAGDNFVIAIVQFSSAATTNIAAGNLRLTRSGTTLMSNVYPVYLTTTAVNAQKWFALMALDSGAPSNPTYDVRATAVATGISGEAKILAISALTGEGAQGSSTAIGTSDTTLATLSSSLPAGDNAVLAILESQNSGSTSTRYLSALSLKRGSALASAQYSVYHAGSGTTAGRWQVQLIPYLDAGAPASAQYTVTATASNTGIYGRATIVAFSRGGLSAAYSDGGSTAILTSETTINTLTTSFSQGYEVAVIASQQFDDTASGVKTITNGNDKLQQDDQSTGQTVNQYTIQIPANGGNDDGKGFGLLNTYSNIPPSPGYKVKATASAVNVNGESKILALCRKPKVPEFPLGPALILAVCFSILYAVRRWRR